MAAKNKSNEITLTRVYDAPVKTVWDAWNDPEQAAHWWGPRGFTLTSHSKDLRAGGTWKYTMHGPDGTDFPNVTKYLEVEKYARMVYDHGGSEDRPPMFRVTVVFTETKGKTKMEMTMSFVTPEVAENTRKFIKKAGGDATWDRLAEYLEKQASDKEQFVINRAFDAPFQLVYEMWTNPKHFSQWLPPTGATMKFLKADVRVGGHIFYEMTGGMSAKLYGRVDYLKIDPKGHLLYTQRFCDENGGPARHPLAPTWPESMLTSVTITEEGPEKTRVTVCWEPQGNVTREEIETFVKAKSGMTLGWTGSFDKLDELLSAAG
jgi:uncharacterized protein YndB with AHSA1/START domain